MEGLRRKSLRNQYAQADDIAKKNKDVVKATVFGGGSPIKKELETHSLTQETQAQSIDKGIPWPLDMMVLTMLEENSTELKQIFDAMEVNIEGFGGRLVLAPELSDSLKEKNKAEIEAERGRLNSFLSLFHHEENLTSFKRKTRRQLEQTGNAYWELVPPKSNLTGSDIAAMNLIESHTMKITKPDTTSTAFEKQVMDPSTGKMIKKIFRKKFPRYFQYRNGKTVYYKDWSDPRIISRIDGKAYTTEAAATKAGLASSDYAHRIYQFKIWTARSPYGIPRYIGNLFSIFGSRAAEEINYNTFLNNNVPSLAILVSGNAMLTEGTIKRINEFTSSIMQRSNNYSKFLLLEAEPATEGLQSGGTAKIDIKPLKNEQHGDQLFQNYDKNNASKVRRAFRLPPIFTGNSDDYNRGTAETSRRLAEEQVFNPEREDMDRHINLILREMGAKYWTYKSYSPNVTDADSLIRLANGLEKTGALTPNFVRAIITSIINNEVRPYKADEVEFNPDIPFSLTMAQAVKQNANLAGNPSTGALAPQVGQMPNNTGVEKAVTVDKLLEVFKVLDSVLSQSGDWRKNV